MTSKEPEKKQKKALERSKIKQKKKKKKTIFYFYFSKIIILFQVSRSPSKLMVPRAWFWPRKDGKKN
jgi:hypothetical protein